MRHRRTHFVQSGHRVALLATAALPLLMASPAFAQTAETDPATPAEAPTAAPEEEGIVVTGLRETIQTSIRTKRDQTAIVDALSSQEIGNIPALSVGEAIQTIAGATTHREKGGASEIALRGLGPFLSNSTFNGRDATNGSGDRAVNFNQFPSELINEIMIYKSQQADLVEGGVAGTIELGTLRPLAFGRQRIQGEFKVNYSPQQNNVYDDDGLGWRGTISYIDQFELGRAGEFGIALGFQRNDTNNPEDTFAASTTWVACDATRTVLNNNCPQLTDQQRVEGDTPFYLAPNALTYRQISEDDRRDAFFGAIQWRPDPSLDINLDFQYSDRTFNEQRNDLNLSEGQRAIDNRVIDPAGFLTAYTGQSSIETVSTLLTRSEEYLGGGLNIAYEPAERLTLRADFSYSRTRRRETERSVRQRTDPRDIFGNVTPINNQRIPYSYELGEGFAPIITIDPRFDVTNWDLFSDDTRIRRDENFRENEIIAGRFDSVYEVEDPFLRSLHAGVRYSRQTYNDYDDRVEINVENPAQEREANLACRVPFQQRDYLGSVDGAIHSWATFDPLCLFEQHLGTDDPGRNADVRSVANRDVTEEVWAGYVMASYATDEDVPLPISGNVGLRVVNTSVTSNGLRASLDVVTNPDGSIRLVEGDDFETVTIDNATTRFLPSANVTFHLQNDLLLRFAVYKAMSRPAPSSLGAGRTITLRDGANFGSIEEAIREIRANGSPRLEPLMSWNADASLEYYLNRDSLFSAAVYYKRFNGGFIPVVADEDFTIGGQPVTVPVVQTANSDEQSRIYGLELTLTHRFSLLPAPFDGLGARLTYTYANSNFENQDIRLGEIFTPATGVTTPAIIRPANLSGFSENVVSAQAYYQKGPLSLQAVYNYRSDYYQDFVGGNNQLRYVRGNDTFDLRASYEFNRNVSVSFEAVNIFDEPKVTDMPVPGSIRQYHYYGPRYFLGVRVRI